MNALTRLPHLLLALLSTAALAQDAPPLRFPLFPPSTAAGIRFGTAVAGDGARVAVGASSEGNGRVHVFDLSSGTPGTPVVTLDNPAAATGTGFGDQVEISGSLVVVAAPMNDTDASDSGRVYVFDVASGTPATPVATLVNPSPAIGDQFGFSIAISGSLVVVGASGDDTLVNGGGVAYLYDVASGTPTVPVLTFDNPDPVELDTFGDGAAIAGDRVIIGCAGDRIGTTRIGAAYIYDLASAAPATPVLKIGNPLQSSKNVFPQTISIFDERVAIGAPQFLPSDPPGNVYVFDLSRRNPSRPALTIPAPPPVVGISNFATRVKLRGSLLAVSDANRNVSGPGLAYIFDLDGAKPATPLLTVPRPLAAADPGFGASVALAGAVLVVGDADDDTAAMDNGAAYTFDLAVPRSRVNVESRLAINDPTLPGAVFDSFSAPDAAVFGGKVRTAAGKKLDAVFDDTGAVLLRGGEMRAVETGGPMAMVMKVMPPTGDAVLASFQRGAGVSADSDQTLFTGLMGGTAQPAVRRGQDIGGGVQLKSFLTLDGNGTTTFFSGTLKGTGVTPANNQALFAVLPPGGIMSAPESGPPATGLRVLVRKGDMVLGKQVRTIATLVGQAGSLAEGRWRSGPDSIGVRITFTDRTQSLFIVPADAASPDDWLLLGQTGDDGAPDAPGAELLSFKLPAYAPQATLFESLLRIGPGGVTARDNGAVFDAVGVEMGGPITRRILARRARPAPSLPTSGLARFRATLAGIARGSTFIAQTTLPGAGSRDSIFDARADGQYQQIARIGDPAPGGGRFTRFVSVARPDTNGYGAFVSALLGGVSPANRRALFAVDSTGELRRVVRTGDRIESTGPGSPLKQIRSFVALSAAPGSIGAARGYDEAGRITVLVTFTDRTQAVVTIQVP